MVYVHLEGLSRGKAVTDMTVVRTRSGWAVSGGLSYYLKQTATRREAEDWITWAAETRAEIATHEAENAERRVAFLTSRGLEPVDYRDIKPGDRYTSSPDGPIRTVTRVEHMRSGASMIWHPTDDMPPGSTDRFTLHVPSVPAFRLIVGSKITTREDQA